MHLSAREYLQHIVVETSYLIDRSVGVDREYFLNDETLKRAFVHGLEVIGEAVKQIPDSLRKEYPEIEWRSLAGMRDRLIHGYFGVDYDIVWDVVITRIPDLKRQCERILAEKFQGTVNGD